MSHFADGYVPDRAFALVLQLHISSEQSSGAPGAGDRGWRLDYLAGLEKAGANFILVGMVVCKDSSPGACGRRSFSRWLPGTKRMQPLATVASVTASQHVAVAVSAVHGGQYAMSWCLQPGQRRKRSMHMRGRRCLCM